MDFALMFNTWKAALLQPGEPVFAGERDKPHATLTTALIWIVIGAAVAAVFSFLQGLLAVNTMGSMDAFFQQADLPPEVAAQLSGIFSGGMMAGLVGAGSLMSIILTPIFFLIGVGILYLIARLLGGTGAYGNYAYLIATFQAPITILNAILALIPFLGGCIGFLLTIYGLVLTYYATKVAHGLTSGKAIAVVLIPLLVVLLLVGCVIFSAIGLIFSTMGQG
jgi:hypothetical protein